VAELCQKWVRRVASGRINSLYHHTLAAELGEQRIFGWRRAENTSEALHVIASGEGARCRSFLSDARLALTRSAYSLMPNRLVHSTSHTLHVMLAQIEATEQVQSNPTQIEDALAD